MSEELHAVILNSLDHWAEMCEEIARSDDPALEVLQLARNLRAARANLEVLYRRRYPAAERKPIARSIAGRIASWW